MSRDPYPSCDVNFFIAELLKSPKIDSDTLSNVGSTHTVLLKDKKPLHKRTIMFREHNGEVGFMDATGNAALYGFMPELLEWFEDNKGWKAGAYIDK